MAVEFRNGSLNGVNEAAADFGQVSRAAAEVILGIVASVVEESQSLSPIEKERLGTLTLVAGHLGIGRAMNTISQFIKGGWIEESRQNSLGRAILRKADFIVATSSAEGLRGSLGIAATEWLETTFGEDRVRRWRRETNGKTVTVHNH